MIPISPQPIVLLQARYSQAVARIHDVGDVMVGAVARPGERPECVFDTETGLRLIVSRERLIDGRVIVHLSASAHEGTPLWARVRAGEISPASFCQIVEDAFAAIADSPVRLHRIGLSTGKGIPHWYGFSSEANA